MRRFRLPVLLTGLIVGLVGLMSAPENCLACSCAPPPGPAVARDRAAAVFAGRVSAIDQGQSADGASHYQVTIQVSTVWKGAVGRETVVFTSSNSASCGYSFEVGKDYLVYAAKTGGETPRAYPDNALSTGLCSRTSPLASAGDDLAALGTGAMPTDMPLPTLPNTGEGYPPTLAAASTPSLLALLFLSAVLLGVGTIGRRKGQGD